MKVYYFGFKPGHGHSFRPDHGGYANTRDIAAAVPWEDFELDSGLAPKEVRQLQGPACIHHREGWTALAFWDRSGDERFGSNSVVMVEGTHDFAAMVATMRERLPWLIERLTFELTEA